MVVNCASGTVMIHGAQTEYIFPNIIDCKFMTFELDIIKMVFQRDLVWPQYRRSPLDGIQLSFIYNAAFLTANDTSLILHSGPCVCVCV